MENPKPQNSTDYSIGAQLVAASISTQKIKDSVGTANLIKNTDFNNNVTVEQKKNPSKSSRDHKGNGRKADQFDLAEELVEIKRIKDRIQRDLKRFEDDKAIISTEIKEIEARIKEAENLGQSNVVKNWEIRLKKARDILNMVEKTAPTVDPVSNEAVINELHAYRRARHEQTQAALKGDDPKAIGEYNRAQAEAFEASQKIEALINKQSEQNPWSIQNAAQDEGVSLTNKQAIEDQKVWELNPGVAPEIFARDSANETMQREAGTFEEKHTDATMPAELGAQPLSPERAELNEKTMKPDLPPLEFTMEEQPAGMPTGNDWQDEAIRNFESKGGKVLDDGSPVLTEVVSESVVTPQEEATAVSTGPETTGEDSKLEKGPRPVLTAEQIEIFVAKNKETRERILGNFALVESKVETRAEKSGLNKGLLRNVGEAWNTFPTRYKILLTAGMAVSGFGAAFLGATATAGTIAAIGAGIRGASGAGMFVMFEKMLKGRAEKGGAERTGAAEIRDTAIAAALSIFIVGVLPGIVRDYAVDHGMAGKVSGLFGSDTTQTEIPLAPKNILDTGAYIETVKPGDSVWKMAERQLEAHYGEKFTGLSPEKQTYIIDAIKDKVAVYPESYGIAGSDASTLDIGENVDFGGLLANKTFMDEAFSGAQDLSPEEITNIGNYSGEETLEPTQTETPARMVPSEEPTKEPLLTDFTAPEQVIPAEITPQNDVSVEGYTSMMPAEFTPSDPQVLAYANQQVHDHINNMFGSKGFLGLGAEDGMNSINWKDPDVGFGNKTVEQVLNAQPSNFPEDGARHFGIEDYSATEKMKSYLTLAGKETGVMPHRGENVQAYINRAAAINIDRFIKNG